jgi:hypothetical protein
MPYRISLLLTASLVLLSGCETTQTVQNQSNYEVCRLSLYRPPLQSADAINEADRQVRLRKLDCGTYAGAMQQQQEQALRILQNASRPAPVEQGMRTYIINGKLVTCTTSGSVTNCF